MARWAKTASDAACRRTRSSRLMHLLGVGRVDAHPLDDLDLLHAVGVVDDDLHEEAVALGLGQGVDALRLDGVLGGQDQEGLGHRVGGAGDRHLLGRHDLEQGRLDLGRGPVDLVGEDEVGEDGAELDVEGLGGRPVDAGADQVGRDEVGRELEAHERAAHHLGQGLHGQGLGQPGDAFQQAVAPGQQAHHHPLDHPVLPDDHLLDLEQGLLEGCGSGEPGRVATMQGPRSCPNGTPQSL